MSFLIVKCEELNDQFECDANRIPMFICDDWKELCHLNYKFEAYAINNDSTLTLVKEWDVPVEAGMALYYWNEEEDPEFSNPTVVKKWSTLSRKSAIPKSVKKAPKDTDSIDDNLYNMGTITWSYNGKYYVYGEYQDNYYALGY